MASNKVHSTEEAESDLQSLNPRDLGWFAGVVVSMLEDDRSRNEWKIDLTLLDDYGEQVWAISDERLFTVFVEREGRVRCYACRSAIAFSSTTQTILDSIGEQGVAGEKGTRHRL